MNFTEVTTMATVFADYEKYATKRVNEGKKPVSMFSFMFGNM